VTALIAIDILCLDSCNDCTDVAVAAMNVVMFCLALSSDFQCPVPDLWLIDDHSVGKVSAVGQPSRPTQPSIPPGSVTE